MFCPLADNLLGQLLFISRFLLLILGLSLSIWFDLGRGTLSLSDRELRILVLKVPGVNCDSPIFVVSGGPLMQELHLLTLHVFKGEDRFCDIMDEEVLVGIFLDLFCDFS